MGRPPHIRRIAGPPRHRLFKPQGVALGELGRTSLSLDELEALRLADLEGLYQEAAAERMDVSRATFARVLASARRKVARFLVEGTALSIDGGAVEERPRGSYPCPVHGQGARRGRACACGPGRRRRGRRND